MGTRFELPPIAEPDEDVTKVKDVHGGIWIKNDVGTWKQITGPGFVCRWDALLYYWGPIEVVEVSATDPWHTVSAAFAEIELRLKNENTELKDQVEALKSRVDQLSSIIKNRNDTLVAVHDFASEIQSRIDGEWSD